MAPLAFAPGCYPKREFLRLSRAGARMCGAKPNSRASTIGYQPSGYQASSVKRQASSVKCQACGFQPSGFQPRGRIPNSIGFKPSGFQPRIRQNQILGQALSDFNRAGFKLSSVKRQVSCVKRQMSSVRISTERVSTAGAYTKKLYRVQTERISTAHTARSNVNRQTHIKRPSAYRYQSCLSAFGSGAHGAPRGGRVKKASER